MSGVDLEEAPDHAARLRAVIDSMLDPHVLLEAVRDADGRIVDLVVADANAAACAYNGLPREEFVGSRLLQLFPGQAAGGLLDQCARVVESGEPLVLDGVAYAHELRGGVRYYDIRAVRVADRVSCTWRDVTVRQEEEEALKASEERLQAILDATGEGITMLDLRTGRYVFMSPSQVRLTGFTMEEINGISVEEALERCHPDDRHVSAEQQRLIAAGESHLGAVEYRWRVKSGEYRWFRDSRRVLRTEDGTPYALVGVSTDITEVVEAREALQHTAARLRAALDSMLDPHVLLEAVRDADGRIVDFTYVDANPAASAYNGLPYEELVGRHLLELLPGHVGGGLLEQYARVVESGEPLLLDDVAYAQELQGGAVRYYDIRGVRVRDGISYTWRDVTARHESAAALAASEERYRMVASNVSDVIVHTRDGVVVWVSPSVAPALGGRPEDWVGRPAVTLVHPDDRRALTEALSAAETGATSGRLRIRGEDGVYHWFEGHVNTYVGADGAPDGVLASLRPVDAEAEMRRLNEELADRVRQRTKQLEAVNSELEEFVYSAAHDLRAPLRAIDGFSQMVADDAADRLDEADRQNLQRVRRAAQHMALLIDRLMSLSSATHRRLRIERVDVSALATDVAEEVCADRSGSELDLVVAPDLAADADAALLRVILASLIDNAWKFTAGRRMARIEVGGVDVDDGRAFFVRDNGAGFDAARVPHLFGPFQRYHTDGEFPGVGVGLATVQRIVARHGGRVWAEAVAGKGATFYFTLGTPVAD